MAEYTIDELARAAGTNVRNVRAYQDRRLLPAPQRRGRAGVYTELHLARLRLIGQLLERGYSLGNIAELLSAWSKGQDIGQLLGLESAISSPWSNELPSSISAAELGKKFGASPDPQIWRQAIQMGLFEPDGDRFRVPSPRLLEVGAELAKAGVPLAVMLRELALLRDDMERIAQRFVNLFVGEVVDKYGEGQLPPPSEAPRLTEVVRRLRPLVRTAVEVELGRALERVISTALSDRVARVLGQMGSKRGKQKKPLAKALGRVAKGRR